MDWNLHKHRSAQHGNMKHVMWMERTRIEPLGVRSGRCWQSHFSPAMRWGDRILLPSSSFRSAGLLESQSGRPTSSSLTYLPGISETARRSALLLVRWCAVATFQIINSSRPTKATYITIFTFMRPLGDWETSSRGAIFSYFPSYALINKTLYL